MPAVRDRARVRGLLTGLLLAVPLACGAVDFGTLFHTPEERQRLDRLRRGEPAEPTIAAPRAAPAVTGYVKRSEGRHTLWVDGVPVPTDNPRIDKLLDPRLVRDENLRKPEGPSKPASK